VDAFSMDDGWMGWLFSDPLLLVLALQMEMQMTNSPSKRSMIHRPNTIWEVTSCLGMIGIMGRG
jgi:hypothetical protein